MVVPAQGIVGQHLTSFAQFAPRQRPGSFSVGQAMEKLKLPPLENSGRVAILAPVANIGVNSFAALSAETA